MRGRSPSEEGVGGACADSECKGSLEFDEDEIILQIQSPFRIWSVERSPTEYSKGYDEDDGDEGDDGSESEGEERDLLEGRHSRMAPSARSAPRHRLLLALVLVMAACVVAALAVHLTSRKRRAEEGGRLIPPDPEVPLPPSPSLERRFTRAAVCSDGRPCSDVGSESLDFCAAALESNIAAVPQRRYSLSGEQRVESCNFVYNYCRRTTVFCLYLQVLIINMSESHFDEYEHYNFEYDKHIYSGHSGKQRTKKEASEHTNHFDPSGHSRKIVTKLQNTEQNKKTEPTKAKS